MQKRPLSPMSISFWYHGTDVQSGLALLNGLGLDAAAAAARKIDGPPGFFLAEDMDDAAFFAARRQGTILEIQLSDRAYSQLRTAGMVRQPIPQGFSTRFNGDELLVTPHAFAVFNQLRAAGEIEFLPARWP
jgi:hypothetical protein